MTALTVRRATVAETRELRHSVLRPGQPLGVLDSPDDAIAVHVGAFDGDLAVGCGRIFPEPHPLEPRAWVLRGMAVLPSYQSRGVGRMVLEELVRIAREEQVPMLWAKGRTSALGFYQRLGWQAEGEEFIHEPSGLPHYLISLTL